MKVLKILLSILFVVIATSCSKGEVEDDFNTNSGNLSGWWIYEQKLEGDGAPTIAWAYWFHGEVVEGEYMRYRIIKKVVFLETLLENGI